MKVSRLIELLKQLDSDSEIRLAVREHDGRDGGWGFKEIGLLPKRGGGFILIEKQKENQWKEEEGDQPFWDTGLV